MPSLLFHPGPGALLMCDFDGFRLPEMVKTRPVVVISPRPRRIGIRLCTIVPLSTRRPNPPKPFIHHAMDPRSIPAGLGPEPSWAKCDMLYTVSWDRLDRVKIRPPGGGKPVYVDRQVLAKDLAAIRRGVLAALNLDPGPD